MLGQLDKKLRLDPLEKKLRLDPARNPPKPANVHL